MRPSRLLATAAFAVPRRVTVNSRLALVRRALAERRERHQAMMDVLRRNSINAWHSSFVDTLESVVGRQPALKFKVG